MFNVLVLRAVPLKGKSPEKEREYVLGSLVREGVWQKSWREGVHL